MNNKVFLCAVLAVVIFAGLAGCGKISKPEPYEGSGYPHSYPRY